MRLFQKFRPEHFFLFCLLATSFKAKAAENIPQTAPSTQPVLTSTIFKDPSDYATYGGTAGNQVFQHYAQQMPGFVANNIRAKQSFEKIFSDMTLTRGKVARESKTPEANLFETLRVKEANPNKDSVASITPVLKYPYMTRLMRSNVQSLEQTNDFKPLDDLFEYQYLKFNARQWLEVIAKFHTVENVIASAVYRMFKGKDGKGDYSTLVFDYKNGWNNGTLQVNPHYTVALLKAFSDAEKGIIDDTVKISYIRVRFKGTDVDTRSIMFPTDNTTKEDLSNIPLALVHPSLENMEYHINQVKAAFEDARRATGDEENKRRRIAKFSYLFALTMPLIRGSAAVNEWMTSGLFEYHKLIGPHKMMDEIAQSSFTFDQFYQEYYKTSFIPKELSSSDIKEFEDFYEKYFYRVTNKSIFEDFLSQPSGVTTQKRDQEVVISLTSYPERMPTTWAAIESLLRQTEKPDRIVLNLFEGEFPDKKLPWPIEQQLNRGLEINWSPINRKVFLKVIPTFQKYPNAAVVAFDDDNIYPNDRLKVLLDAYKEHPDCVIGQDVRVIPSIDGVIPPVAYWLLTGYTTPNEEMEPAFNLAPEGYQGILYPPHSLFDHFDDATFYERLCPTDDDIWMYTSTIAKGFKTFKPKNTTQKLNFIERAQKSSKTLGAIN
ncbi:MAG: hypothetical protein KBD31_05140, partial [Proteobacteria bacterium]|nr:hypothetical protein [Pseudomonadota bacterium]